MGLQHDRLSGSLDSGQHGAPTLKDAVLVLGMHRSGTSSVAGALVALGGGAPLHQLPPQPDNEKGFWESIVLLTLNDEILAAGGSHWKDLRAFDLERIDPKAAAALHARAKAALASEFRDAAIPIVKDPRMCRLMRFWAPVFEESQWSARAVLPLRSPLEAALSLHRRDGLGVSWGCLLWMRHVLDAEAETRAMPRAVLDWSQFLVDKRGTLERMSEQLELTWPNGGESAFADIDELVSPGLRHHTATEADLRADPAISDFVLETHSATLELIDDPRNERVLRKLDDLRARFESAAAIFGEATREADDARSLVARRAAEREALAAQLAAERDAAVQATAERDAAAQAAAERDAAAQLAAERHAGAQLAAERDALAAQLAAERHAGAQLAAERDVLAAQLAAERRAGVQLAAERDNLTLQLSAANSKGDLLLERVLEADGQIDHAEAAIAEIGRRYLEKHSAAKRVLIPSPWNAISRRLGSLSVSAKDIETIRNSVFFDERHYLETNPDVREAGLDAALHYLLYGALEGRDPGPFFSSKAYLGHYPDVAEANLNPLLHYEAFGRRENRGLLSYSIKIRRPSLGQAMTVTLKPHRPT